MANASLKSSASSSPKLLRASAPSIEISSSPKAQLSLSSGSPRTAASASSDKQQQGGLSPKTRSRGASPSRSPKPAAAFSSDRALLEPSDRSSPASSRRASMSEGSSHSEGLRRSTDGKSPRKASLAVVPLEGRVFDEEKCFVIRDQWQSFAPGVPIIETKSNTEMFRTVPLGDFDAELRAEPSKDCRIHISFRTPSLLASIMTAKYRLRIGGSSGDELASISEGLSLSSKPKFSADVKGAQVKLLGSFFDREFTITVNDVVTCAPLQDTWLLLALVMVVDRVRKENQRAASSSQSLAVSL